MKRGRCQRCTRAGEVMDVSYTLNGRDVIRRRLCEHCAVHSDTPAINCKQCFPEADHDRS